MGTPSCPIPLTGADCFLRAFHREVTRVHGSGHLSQLVLRLEPGARPFDAERLRAVLARVAEANPILRAPVLRSGGVGLPYYRAERAANAPLPEVCVHAPLPAADGARLAQPDAPIPEPFFAALNARMATERGELLRADVVPYGEHGEGGTDLAFTWAHMLLDGSGSEAFVRLLDAVARGERDAGAVPAGDQQPDAAETKPRGPFRAWSQQARTWQQHVQGMAEHAPHSLAGPAKREPQRLRYSLSTLDPDETRRVEERARKQAGVLTPMLFYLAASIRAHAAVFEKRGADPGSFVVPVPVNLRPKGDDGGIFRTRVSMFWFQVLAEQAQTLEGCVAELKRQRHALIKAGGVANGVAAMDLVRWMPSRLYAGMARRTLRGELCSFFFAYTGAFLPGLTHFLGAPVANGFHTPSVPPSPGSGAILSVREGRLNLTHVFQQGVLGDDERALLRDALLHDLLAS